MLIWKCMLIMTVFVNWTDNGLTGTIVNSTDNGLTGTIVNSTDNSLTGTIHCELDRQGFNGYHSL